MKREKKLMNKVIHYCWFGNNEKPEKVKRCIESWKRYLPDFEVREWNENNFDINCCNYVKEAYKAGKYAFVADYARFYALSEYGGLYFDTDVEIIRPMDDILGERPFAGYETDTYVAPGLVLWEPNIHSELMKIMLDMYKSQSFFNEDGSLNKTTICIYFTEALCEYGLKQDGEMQLLDNGYLIYPKEYFCPFDDRTGVLNITENTYTIHWYDKTWMSRGMILRNRVTRIIHRYLGIDSMRWIKKLIK